MRAGDGKQGIKLQWPNDLPSSLNHSDTFLFADDTKCLRPVCSPHDCSLLQSDLDALSSWSIYPLETDVQRD